MHCCRGLPSIASENRAKLRESLRPVDKSVYRMDEHICALIRYALCRPAHTFVGYLRIENVRAMQSGTFRLEFYNGIFSKPLIGIIIIIL